jgi:alkyl sulfatase BDS1-like metallo-beta-lactamase superfamily hydrolase
MVLNHVVFAEPDHAEARNLLADAYTQMAYGAESGPWRNFFLTGALELREGFKTNNFRGSPNSAEMITNMNLESLYDYLAVKLDRKMAADKEYRFNMIFPDTDEVISLHLVNQVLHNRPGVLDEKPNTTITMNRSVLNQILTQQTTGLKKVLSGEITIEGNSGDYSDFQKMLAVDFPKTFNIIEP